MITLTQKLNVVSIGVSPIIHLSQYDSDFSLVFELYASTGNFTLPSGTTAEIRGTKADGNGYDADATVSGTTITVTGDEQMTAAAGCNVFEIALYKSGKRLNTINFILQVEHAALDADTITSESVLKELNAIIEGAATATQAAQDADAAADRAEAAANDLSGTVQQVATNTQDIANLKDDLSHIEPGLSDNAKEALLACFRNVVWFDWEQSGQAFYNALETALYSDAYPKITATYLPNGHIVHQGDSLDSLKPYLTVMYYESASSTGVVVASNLYSLSGNLSQSASLIAVSYSGCSTAVNIPVSLFLYGLNAPSVFDGTNTINTGIQPIASANTFTIIFDFIDAKDYIHGGGTNQLGYVFCVRDDDTSNRNSVSCRIYDGGDVSQDNKTYRKIRHVVERVCPLGWKDIYFDQLFLYTESSATTSGIRVKAVTRYYADGSFDGEMTADGVVIPITGTYDEVDFAPTNAPLVIGGRNNRSGGYESLIRGTMNDFRVFDYAFTDSEMNDYLGIEG